MTSISLRDRECRFILEHPSNSLFTRLLGDLGVRLPNDLSIQDMVRYGWITPELRLPLTASFVQSWDHFGSSGLDRFIDSEDVPLDVIWSRAATLPPEVPRARCVGVWWQHPFESARYPLGGAAPLEPFVRSKRISPDSSDKEPPSAHDASLHEVQGWLDFFQGWQAFQVHDILKAARLHAPLLNTPDSTQRAAILAERIDEFRHLSDGWIERARRIWRGRREAFDHLYRYRTLLGIWVGRNGNLRQRRSGARALAQQLGLDTDSLKNEIRDHLLVAWSQLSDLPAIARERLRTDVAVAVEWLSALEGRPVDAYDEFWDPADRNPREWERLPLALPFELDQARSEFPRRALYYLERFNSYVPAPMRYAEHRIAPLIQEHWSKRLSLRRFCLAFHRLHTHYTGAVNKERDVKLVAESPIDFLVLATLHAEKLQAELSLGGRRQPLDSFKGLVLGRARAIGLKWNLPRLEERVRLAWKVETTLHSLTSTRRTPFRMPRGRTTEMYLADSLLNFAKLRNYCAHHDILDWKLLNTRVGAPAIEALVLMMLLTLES